MIFGSVNDLATMEMIFRIIAPVLNEANRRYSELKWRNKRKDLLVVHTGLSKPRRGRKPRPKLARVV